MEEEKGYVRVVQEGNTSKDFFFDELRQRRYKNRVAIIHFAGHADGATLRFESEEGQEESMDVDTLAQFLRTITGLHLVFLNGCGTQPIVKKLLQEGIPVVIATQTQVQDEQAARVAEEFYQGIAGGYTIEESFAQARAIAQTEFDFHKLSEGDISRAMFWENTAESEPVEEGFPWGLYTLEGQEEHLQWRLDTQEAKPLAKEKPWYRRAEGIIGLLSLIAAIIFGVLELNVLKGAKEDPIKDPSIIPISDPVDPDTPSSLREQIDALETLPTYFGEDREETYNVLLLPFQQLSLPVTTVEGYVKSRLRGLAGASGLPLNIKVREPEIELDLESELLNLQDARTVGEKFGADMVIWGKYFYDTNTPNEIKLAVSSGSPVNRFSEREILGLVQERQRDMPLPTYPYPDYIQYTKITREIEDAIFYARGNESVQQESYETAIGYLEKIQSSFVPVHLQFANCFEALAAQSSGTIKNQYFQRLVSRLDSVSQQAPDIKNAFVCYYEGILFEMYGTGTYKGTKKSRAKAAQDAYSKAIAQDSDLLKAYFRRGRLYHYQLSSLFKNKAETYYDSALLDYNAFIERDPSFAYVYHDKGRLYHYHLIDRPGAVDSALVNYNRAIALEPEFRYAYEDRGRLYQTYLDNDRLAKEDFNKAIRFGGTSYSYFYRGLIYHEDNDIKNALIDYSKAVRMNTNLSNDPHFKENIYSSELVSQPLPPGEESVYAQLAKIYEKRPQDSLLYLKNAEIILNRENASQEKIDAQLKRKAQQNLRKAGRMSGG